MHRILSAISPRPNSPCTKDKRVTRFGLWFPTYQYLGTQRHRVIILLVGWLVVLRMNVTLAVFQPYCDLEVGDNQSLKLQVARPIILLKWQQKNAYTFPFYLQQTYNVDLGIMLWHAATAVVFRYYTVVFRYYMVVFHYYMVVFRYYMVVFRYYMVVFCYYMVVFGYYMVVFRYYMVVFCYYMVVFRYYMVVFCYYMVVFCYYMVIFRYYMVVFCYYMVVFCLYMVVFCYYMVVFCLYYVKLRFKMLTEFQVPDLNYHRKTVS